MDKKFEERKGELSHEIIFLETNNTMTGEIQNTPDHSDIDVISGLFCIEKFCDDIEMNEFSVFPDLI